MILFLALATRGCDLASAHQVADVLLQELVVVIKLVVFFANSLDAVKDCDKRILQCLGMSWEVSDALIYQVEQLTFSSLLVQPFRSCRDPRSFSLGSLP